jgi:hypothetical protein
MKTVKFKPERIKTVIGLLVIAILIAKCTKNEIADINSDNINTIGFGVNTGKTRASIVDLPAIQTDAAGFGVYATKANPAKQFINNNSLQ